MNELEHVGDALPHVPFTDDNLARARSQFQQRLAAEQQPEPSPARRWMVPTAVVGGLAAAVAVTVLVISTQAQAPGLVEADPTTTTQPTTTPSTTPSPTPTVVPEPPATAQAALAMASGAVTANGALADGTWRQVTMTSTFLGTFGPVDMMGVTCGATRDEAMSAWQWTTSYTSYVTTNPDAEWVRIFNNEPIIGETFGDNPEARATECLANISMPDELRGTGTLGGEASTGPGSEARYYATLPDDPQQLLDKLRADFADSALDGVPVDSIVATQLITDLQLGVAAVPVRAAMFEALGMLGNATLIATDGDNATIRLAFAESGTIEDITVDTSTGNVVSGQAWYGSPGTLVTADIPDYEYTIAVTTTTEIP